MQLVAENGKFCPEDCGRVPFARRVGTAGSAETRFA
jgi:hypothetical protein